MALLFACAALTSAPARADVRVTIANGKVSVVATDATVRQILAEWARVGQATIVNAERLSGPPMSLELTDVPESEALDTLLRSASGYVAAPRQSPRPDASQYDRIFLLPTSSGVPARPATAAAGPVFTPPPFPQPDDQNDDNARPAPGVVQQPGAPQPRGPAFNTFPQPAVPQRPAAPPVNVSPGGPAPAAPTFGAPSVPNAPVGVSTPGMVVPAPPQPGQAQPGQPQQNREP